jgi:hypothetical protein
MAMEVRNTPIHDMDCFIKECVRFFHNRRLEGHLSFFFCIHFFTQHVNIALQCALASIIERKIALTRHACSKLVVTIKSHDLHACDIIKKVVGEISSQHDND